MSNQLTPQNRERAIDALARNNNIIKSLFPYQKHISFLVVSLAIQKIKIKAHKGGLVVITKNEIQSLATGRDSKNGINNLIKAIRKDLELHNFFNLYKPNLGLTDIRQALIHSTALTKDLFNDLTITFNRDLFATFQAEKNYTIQSLQQLRNCNENQVTAIYALTQPYAKAKSPNLTLNILELRTYLRIADDAYAVPRTLTMRIKKISQMVSTKTDINLSVKPIKKNTKTGVTVGYSFHAEFKNKKSKRITDVQQTTAVRPTKQANKIITTQVIKQQPISNCLTANQPQQSSIHQQPNINKQINISQQPNIKQQLSINKQPNISTQPSIRKQIKPNTNTQLSIRKQLSNWGVSNKQINRWIANLGNKTISDAIKQTLNRNYREDKNSNAGGYIYSILGDGKSLKLSKQIKTHKQLVNCLEKFGLSEIDINQASKQTTGNRNILIAIANKCLRELENETVDEDSVRQFFIAQLDEILGELNKIRKIKNA